MKRDALNVYRSPLTGNGFQLAEELADGDSITVGELTSGDEVFRIEDGMPFFAKTEELGGTAAFARGYYREIAETYDANVRITFDLYNEDELQVRNSMVSLLQLNRDSKVLEISAGTGKDSSLIASNLGAAGEIWLLDISPHMLQFAREKLSSFAGRSELAVGDACFLPYRDAYFDALYCFAGVGHFTNQRRAFAEMARVVKPGGRVVFAEKNVPPWLRDTEYGKILINNNPMFAQADPLALLPVSVRKAGIRWILGEVHYVVDFTVGEGAPKGNFDLELPGHRGGTFNTRYFGRLEGVTPEAKALCERAATARGLSLHKWLDEAVRQAASRDLSK
ncbi:MAG: class I SAM-dependent methyltransferase [Burkholderiales bacterium]